MLEDKDYIGGLHRVAKLSDDVDTAVSALIVNDKGEIISEGANTLPIGIDKTYERCDKPLKYQWLLHAERNAIFKAARHGISTQGCSMYINRFPCVECSRAIIQAGIKRIIVPDKPDLTHHKWGESWRTAIEMLEECGVEITYHNEPFKCYNEDDDGGDRCEEQCGNCNRAENNKS